MFEVRRAREGDAAALVEIYRPAVEQGTASFELECPTAPEIARRIATSQAHWEWLVAEQEGEIVGYAYGTSHRSRPAYRWSVEVSAYVHPDHHRRGVGRSLYRELLARLGQMGYCQAFAGITLPNPGSVALHRSLGFEPIGVFHRIGWKFGRWHDVGWYERVLADRPCEDDP